MKIYKKYFFVLFLLLAFGSLAISQTSVYVDTTYFYAAEKNIKSQIEYEVINGDTIKNGNALFYYINGNLMQTGNYLKGEMSGKWTTYYPDGIKKRESFYIDGLKNGKVISYHPNGNIKYIGNFIDDSLSG